ncbi:MAG TPA: methylase [Rhodocyclaceae bacterium]|nr:MAG: methylase [Betaproteobacteria bacterium CG2_30_68_42]PIV72576.1 MAG: methylase [Rhodocyclales bacterium CG17_big_fil_post_rev_8_21_14_2_50_68_7]PJA57150.1 MAG: methylase [Rhodocyclales bacterium CG_4_9_14_3_um_filter_68_10]HCX34418.1 methylase [Rhodocyclaceae bacterium]
MEKPDAPSCARNREPILEALRKHFVDRREVLEIGSGTGQHAIFFAAAMPHLTWQTSDCSDNLAGIRAWLDEAALPNTPAPLALDVNAAWPQRRYDAVFTANTLHILRWGEVERLFACLPEVMTGQATLAVYGPFNYEGRFTSEGNAAFDVWLKERGRHQGIRDFEAVDALARQAGLALAEDRAMPSNNRCLIWRREEERGCRPSP